LLLPVGVCEATRHQIPCYECCIAEDCCTQPVTDLRKDCMQNSAALHEEEFDREAGGIKQLLELLEGKV